jgi:hypothetical protein
VVAVVSEDRIASIFSYKFKQRHNPEDHLQRRQNFKRQILKLGYKTIFCSPGILRIFGVLYAIAQAKNNLWERPYLSVASLMTLLQK